MAMERARETSLRMAFSCGGKRTLLESNECGDAEYLAAHDERNGGVGADAVFGQVIFVAEPAVFFEEIVAGIGFASEFAGFFFVGIRKQGTRFG